MIMRILSVDGRAVLDDAYMVAARRCGERVISLAPLIVVLVASTYTLWVMSRDTLLIPWPTITDEFPYAQEVLRFIGLDFRQQFFDIPGTPFIFLTTALWSCYYWVLTLSGIAEPPTTITEFSFQQIQSLYIFLRLCVLVLDMVSVVLMYLVGRRLTNAVGGCVAALFLTFSSVYSDSAWYIRIEPLAVVLVLSTLYFWLVAHRSGDYRLYFLAGLTSGLSMAARFPVILATLPVLVAYQVFGPTEPRPAVGARRWRWPVLGATGLPFLLAAAVVIAYRTGLMAGGPLTNAILITTDPADGTYPLATRLVGNLWIVLGAAVAAILLGWLVPASRRFARCLVEPRMVLVYAGTVVGVLVGTPTLLWSGRFLLRSMELFLERNAYGATGQLVQEFLHMVGLYWTGVAPGPIEMTLLVAGVGLAVGLGNRQLWPIIVAATIGIVSQWGKLQTERHMLAWFPYFYVLMAYPVALASRWAARRAPELLATGGAAFLLLAVFLVLYGRVPTVVVSDATLTHLARSGLQGRANDWLLANTAPGTKIFHVCCDTFNDQVIFDWMAQNGVNIPDSVRSGRDDRVWFGDKQTLAMAGDGYCVVTQKFAHYYIDYYAKLEPQKVVDPSTDSHFQLVAVFESDDYVPMEIYRFNFHEIAP
jgi:Dolichyl-phosphate-mannose-protein mannosyltransferase